MPAPLPNAPRQPPEHTKGAARRGHPAFAHQPAPGVSGGHAQPPAARGQWAPSAHSRSQWAPSPSAAPEGGGFFVAIRWSRAGGEEKREGSAAADSDCSCGDRRALPGRASGALPLAPLFQQVRRDHLRQAPAAAEARAGRGASGRVGSCARSPAPAEPQPGALVGARGRACPPGVRGPRLACGGGARPHHGGMPEVVSASAVEEEEKEGWALSSSRATGHKWQGVCVCVLLGQQLLEMARNQAAVAFIPKSRHCNGGVRSAGRDLPDPFLIPNVVGLVVIPGGEKSTLCMLREPRAHFHLIQACILQVEANFKAEF